MENLKELIESEGSYHEWDVYGLKCEVSRHDMGHWCGYITIPSSDVVPNMQYENMYVHGGVSYTSKNKNGDQIVGFDAAHAGDLIPHTYTVLKKYYRGSTDDSIYRTKQYMIEQTNNLAKQILFAI